MYAKKHRPMQKLTAICLSVTIAAASLLSGHVFASDEAPQTDYLTGWELLAELREMGLGQDVILDEEAPESDNSSETNTEDPSDTTGEPGDGDQTDGTEPGNPDEGGSGEGATDPGESTPEQPGDGDQTGGTEPGNPDGNNPGEGGSGEGDTDTDTDPGTDNPDNSAPAAGTDSDEGDGTEQGSDQNQPSAPAESTEPAPDESTSKDVPLVTQNDEMTVNDPQTPGETPAAPEEDNPPAPSDEQTPSEDPGDDGTTTTPGDDNTSQNPDENPGGETTTPPEEETGDNQVPSGGDEIDPGFGVDPSTPIEELPETSGITEEQRAALEAYVQTLEAEQVVSLDETNITTEEYEDLYSMLTSGQISDLYDYLNPPVSMTDVPSIFELYESQLPSVRPLSLPMKRNADALTDSPGLETTKTVTVDPDDLNQFNVTLEAFANGQETTVYTGLDIILVLDTSQNVKGKWMETLKEAVNGFIESVVAESKSDNPHRIAAVEFGSDDYLLWGSKGDELWDASEEKRSLMQNEVNGLETRENEICILNTGVERAEEIVSRLANENQPNRKTVVIIFASDLPKSNTGSEDGWNFAHTTATKAVQSANDMKQMGATIYTIGVYDGVDPDELYGSGIYRGNYEAPRSKQDVECKGHSHAAGNSGNNRYTNEWGNNNSDEAGYPRDIPTANRMMNLMSSNFNYSLTIGEKGLGVEYHSSDNGRKITYDSCLFQSSYIASTIEITQEYRFKGDPYADECNADIIYGEKSGFFAGTEDADELTEIFKGLTDIVGGSAIELDENAVLKDVVTPYFEIVGDVSAYSVDESGEEQTFRPVVDGNTITVTDFDYEAHYVGKDSTNPQKLVVTFTIERKDAFLGGNAVPTNGDESGVYKNADDASSNTSVVENFERPKVNVPIKYTFTTNPQTIYLGNAASLDAAVNLGEYTWEDAFVNITLLEEWHLGNQLITELVPSDCCDPFVHVVVEPKYQGDGFSGEVQSEKNYDRQATVHVLKPIFTFKDTKEDSGERVDLTKKNLESTEWSDFNDGHSAGTATGPVPTFVLTYNRMETGGNKPDGASFTVDSVANFKLAGVTIDGFDVTLERDIHYKVIPDEMENCDVGLGTGHTTGRDFTIHLNNFNLTIEKKLATGTTADPNESFRIIVTNAETGFTTSFMLKPNEKVILTNLPAGIYTISEDTDWSWRYDESQTTVQVNDGTTTTASSVSQNFTGDSHVTFTNTKTNNHWLSWEDTKVNIFNPAS